MGVCQQARSERLIGPKYCQTVVLTQLSHLRLAQGAAGRQLGGDPHSGHPQGISTLLSTVGRYGLRGTNERKCSYGRERGRKLSNHPSNAHMVLAWHRKERAGGSDTRAEPPAPSSMGNTAQPSAGRSQTTQQWSGVSREAAF